MIKTSERKIEMYLVMQAIKMGGVALKFISPGTVGVPDRLVIFPKGRIAFVELKASGEKPRPIQIRRMKQLQNLGCKTFVVDSKERVREVLEEVKGYGI